MDKLIYRPKELAQVIGVAPSTLYQWVAAGEFPKPIKLAGRATGWRAEDITEWIDSRPTVGVTA